MDYFIYNFEKFLLVFSRIFGLFMTVSFLSSESIPEQIRMGIMFVVTTAIYPMVSHCIGVIPENFIEYALMAVGEGIIGVAIGTAISISFSVFQLAGQFFTVQMGFGASEVFDPMSQISLPLMGLFLDIIFVMVFMSLNGPALIISAIYQSFELVNFSDLISVSMVTSKYGLITIFTDLFITGLKISLPLLGALLLVSVTMGLLAKAAPQLNLMMIGFPISIYVGFTILLFMTPVMINLMQNLIDFVFRNVWFMMEEINHVPAN